MIPEYLEEGLEAPIKLPHQSDTPIQRYMADNARDKAILHKETLINKGSKPQTLQK